jgi:hypothetical protein
MDSLIRDLPTGTGLERLKQRLPTDRAGKEDFYARLAEILCHCAAARFGLDAPFQTAEQLKARPKERADRSPPAVI